MFNSVIKYYFQLKTQCRVRLRKAHNTPSPDSVLLRRSSLTSILLIINQSLTIYIRLWMCLRPMRVDENFIT